MRAVSTKTIAAAAKLPSSVLFNGSRSIKHTTLTKLVYKTMKRFGLPRSLAFACWNRADWLCRPGGRRRRADERRSLDPRLLAFEPAALAPPRTRRLHRHSGPSLEQEAERPSGGRAHDRHPRDAARLRRPERGADELLGGAARALLRHQPRHDPAPVPTYMGTLARNYIRARAPAGLLERRLDCRDGGAWDLFPWRNLG